MNLTITLSQLRTALRALEANISADALFDALQAAPVQTPDKARARAHYEAEAAIALAMLAEPAGFCGPMLTVLSDDKRFCVTGSTFSQPVAAGLLRDGFSFTDCGSLDAPGAIPTGSISLSFAEGLNFALAIASDCRERMGQRAAEQAADYGHAWSDDDMVYA